MSLTALIHWLNETGISVYLRESELAFPLTEAIHLLGLAMSVGTILWVDLRLMGLVMRRDRVADVIGRLEPWAIGGFAVMIVSGFLLFLGKPDNYYSTTPFRIKMLLMPVAALNVLLFHRRIYPRILRSEAAGSRQGWLTGFVSASLWLVVIVLGRWTAYFADELFRRSR